MRAKLAVYVLPILSVGIAEARQGSFFRFARRAPKSQPEIPTIFSDPAERDQGQTSPPFLSPLPTDEPGLGSSDISTTESSSSISSFKWTNSSTFSITSSISSPIISPTTSSIDGSASPTYTPPITSPSISDDPPRPTSTLSNDGSTTETTAPCTGSTAYTGEPPITEYETVTEGYETTVSNTADLLITIIETPGGWCTTVSTSRAKDCPWCTPEPVPTAESSTSLVFPQPSTPIVTVRVTKKTPQVVRPLQTDLPDYGGNPVQPSSPKSGPGRDPSGGASSNEGGSNGESRSGSDSGNPALGGNDGSGNGGSGNGRSSSGGSDSLGSGSSGSSGGSGSSSSGTSTSGSSGSSGGSGSSDSGSLKPGFPVSPGSGSSNQGGSGSSSSPPPSSGPVPAPAANGAGSLIFGNTSPEHQIPDQGTTTTISSVRIIANPSSIIIGDQLIPITAPTQPQTAITANGVVFTVEPSSIIGGSTVITVPTGFTPSPTPNSGGGRQPKANVLPSQLPTRTTIGQLTLSLSPTLAVIAGNTYLIGAPAIPTTITYAGTPISLGPNGIGLPSTTITPPPQILAAAPIYSTAIIDGVTVLVGSSGAVISGTTYAFGSSTANSGSGSGGDKGTTIVVDGHTLTIGPEGVIAKTTTATPYSGMTTATATATATARTRAASGSSGSGSGSGSGPAEPTSKSGWATGSGQMLKNSLSGFWSVIGLGVGIVLFVI